MPSDSLRRLAGRVPQRWRRRVPTRLRNSVVARIGHPVEPFDPSAYPPRLNLGCGFDIRAGYLNVDLNDFHRPDMAGDVRSLPELPSGHYEEILAQDVLEHLERADGPKALAEWRRLLKPGGRLLLRVPDLPSMLRWLRERDDADHHRRVLHHMFGTQAYDGDFHLSGYTELLLCDELFRAGFGDIEMEIKDGWLWEAEAVAAGAPVGVAWGPGFYQREADGRRWAGERAELCICVPEPSEVTLSLSLSRHDDAQTVVHIDGEPVAPGERTVPIVAGGGATRLTFTTDGETASDGRGLAFCLDRASVERTLARTG